MTLGIHRESVGGYLSENTIPISTNSFMVMDLSPEELLMTLMASFSAPLKMKRLRRGYCERLEVDAVFYFSVALFQAATIIPLMDISTGM